MRRAMVGLSFVLLPLTLTIPQARAADAPPAPHGGTVATAPHGATAHLRERPVLPEPSPLPGLMVICIGGLFLAAAVVGVVVRYHAPEEPPEPESQDEHGHAVHDAHGH